jgi:hypothetical protein
MKHRADHATLGRSLRPRGPIHLDLSTRQASEATVITVTGELDVLTARRLARQGRALTVICGEGPVRRAIEFARLLEPLGVVPSLAEYKQRRNSA